MLEGSRIHLRRMKPAAVMVRAAVTSDGSKSTLVFIEEGVRVNAQDNIKLLTEKELPWIAENFGNCYVYTQDGAPSRISNLTQQFLEPKHVGLLQI